MDDNIIEDIQTKSNGEKTIKKYLKGRILGSKAIECFEFTNLETSRIYAGKVFPKSKLKNGKMKQRVKSEIRIQSKLAHPNILKFEKFFEDSENFYILYELCINKTVLDLLKRRKRLTEIEASCYINQILSGLKYLHSFKVIHRDLRLNKLFLSENLELKIGDFSKSAKVEYEGERKKSMIGVPNFMAPEVIEGSHSYEADIWSVGIFLYTVLVGRPPFHSDHTQETYTKIKSGIISYPAGVQLSDSAKDLISKILVVNWKDRITIDGILASDFVTMKNVPKLMSLATLVAPPETSEASRRKYSQIGSEALTQEQFKAKMTGNIFTGHGIEGEIFVKKWIDYTWKYGLGYLMSNGNCGVSFIDSTRMILNSATGQIFYMDKVTIYEYALNGYPDDLKKKVTLLQYFKSFLESDVETSFGDCDGRLPIYLKKWMITHHSIIFRLSSRLVQVNFLDHSELSLNCDSRVVSFANRKGEKLQMSLNKALQTNNVEILRRLKYTRDAIQHMIKFKI